VRRGVKVLVWTGVFAVCAGAGAFVAAHTNPFPPGVEDPGARPTTPPPTSPSPTNERWTLGMFSATKHVLHVGGSCRSTWQTRGPVTIDPDGIVTGTVTARLRSWSCDFAVAQVQTRLVRLTVSGDRSGDRIAFAFSIEGSAPTGSQDLGGFASTVEHIRPNGQIVGGSHAGIGVHATRPDGDLGRYTNDSEVQLDCVAGC
jgi:hypothetical protein